MEFTARNAAKHAVKALIAGKVASLAKDFTVDHTGLDEDNRFVGVGSYLIAWVVADKVKPHTDKMVDKAADFIVEKRAQRAAKKNTEEK